MRLLVCGSRRYADRQRLHQVLDTFVERHGQPTLLIHGAARGADTLAGEWARARSIPVREFPADWATHRRRAGYLRNAEMLREGRPDVVIGFPIGESRGTTMMLRLAKEAGIETFTIHSAKATT